MTSQGSKVIAATLIVTVVLIALIFIVYIERNLGESGGKIPNPKSQIPTKSQSPNPKVGTDTFFTDKPSDETEKKVSVPISDEELFDKYPPDKELSVEEHIKYVLKGRFKKWPPEGFKEWIDKNRFAAIPFLLKLLAAEGGNVAEHWRWKIMTFLDSFTAPEAMDKLYDIATTALSENTSSRQYAILALKNYGEKAVDYLLDIYNGGKTTFVNDEDRRTTKNNVITSLALIAGDSDTKDPQVLERLASFFKEQYYQKDVRPILVNALSGGIEQNPRQEFLPFFQMAENDPHESDSYKELAKQTRIKLEILNSPDADKQLVNILYTNYNYDVPSQDLDTYKAIRIWAAREMVNKDRPTTANLPVHTRILHLRNIINTENNRPYNVDDQLIRWCMSSVINLGEELTPEEREILRNLH